MDILIHYHTVEWNNGILAFIKLHHILVVTFKCLINLRHGIDNFSSPPFKIVAKVNLRDQVTEGDSLAVSSIL